MIDISEPEAPKLAGCARVTDPPTNNYVHDGCTCCGRPAKPPGVAAMVAAAIAAAMAATTESS
ncbi:MAG TPA: hypothetical protein VG126_06335 [Thermoleophilaceae bacterium]|nr:hypothetical protein [Thermoleophilaceae bacterium]